MKSKIIKTLIKYGITVAVGGSMAYAVIWLHGYAEAESAVDRYRILADAFTIPGVVLIMIGVLVWLSNKNAFSGITYALGRVVRALIPGGRTTERYNETYFDYIARKKDEGGVKHYGFIFITGLAYFLTAVVFIALFYSVYNA